MADPANPPLSELGFLGSYGFMGGQLFIAWEWKLRGGCTIILTAVIQVDIPFQSIDATHRIKPKNPSSDGAYSILSKSFLAFRE